MIKRAIFEPLKAHLQQKEITLIVGPRQAGKTTLMQLLKDDLDREKEPTLFLSLDSEEDKRFFDSQRSLIQKIEYTIGKKRGFVFLDEIQRKENAGLFLKGIYDMMLPYKFIISGSGSVELKEKVHESLAGRKRVFEVSTLSFEEFADFKLEYQYSDRLPAFFSLHPYRGKELLGEYLNFGGYPRVILAETIDEKKATIADIYKSYLEKDIALLLRIQKSQSLANLVRILASQTGNLVNISELSSTLELSMNTVSNYLWYLEKTFIIHKVTPYYKNIRKEITRMSTIYFIDLGLKNYAIGQFGSATSVFPQGYLFQNFVYNALRINLRSAISRINFWRTKDKAEVDFIINMPSEVIPVEVKYSVLKNPGTSRSFKSFLNKYHPSKAYIVHLGEKFEYVFNNTKIFFIPYYEAINTTKEIP